MLGTVKKGIKRKTKSFSFYTEPQANLVGGVT